MKHKQSEIPDWRLGEKSITPYQDRIDMMNEWLKENNKEIISTPKIITEETEMVGFIDD